MGKKMMIMMLALLALLVACDYEPYYEKAEMAVHTFAEQIDIARLEASIKAWEQDDYWHEMKALGDKHLAASDVTYLYMFAYAPDGVLRYWFDSELPDWDDYWSVEFNEEVEDGFYPEQLLEPSRYLLSFDGEHYAVYTLPLIGSDGKPFAFVGADVDVAHVRKFG